MINILGVPVDSKVFKNINDAQWSWYHAQTMLDERDKFELGRDLAEHNAMFWNPEGVQQIRDARENSFKASQEEFSDTVKNVFGRELPADMFEGKGKPLTEKDLKNMRGDMDPYLGLDLDEIDFTPL